MTKAYLIHGTSTRDDDWFPWLEEAVAPAISLDRIWLPEPFNPSPTEWARAIDQQVPAENGIVLVAHSLGCISALRFIERQQIRDARLLLVGAFDQPLPTSPQLDGVVTPPLQYDQVTPKVSQATVIAAQDDPIAPFTGSAQVARALNAKFIGQAIGGHFLSSGGFTTFPLAAKELQRIAK